MNLFDNFELDLLKLQNLSGVNSLDASADGNQGGTGHGGPDWGDVITGWITDIITGG